MFGTLNHEALHAMKELGFFSPADWGILSNKARSTWIKQYNIAERYPNLTAEEQIEEAIAEAFANAPLQEPQVQSLMEKLLNAITKLGNFLRGYGYRSAEQIFGEATSGQLAKKRADALEGFTNALNEATKDLDIMMRPRSKKTHFASQKSDIVIIKDLYRAILRNYDLPQDKFEASSVGWKVTVEKPLKVSVDWNPLYTENYGWTMKYVKK